MKVNFYATLRPIVGGKTVDLSFDPGQTAKDLLDLMISHYPPLRDELLDEDGKMFGHVHFFINGRDVRFLESEWETVLKPEDVINVFPAVGGG